MTDEEKQAIEFLKIDCLITLQQINDGKLFMIEDEEKRRVSATQVLLNLIDKQQKEIDFFRNNNCCFESTKQGLYAIQIKPENYVPKDKIKEKIEELNNRKIGASTGIFAVQVDILEELLEE